MSSAVFAASPYLDRYELPEESIIYQNHFDGENATLGDGWTIQQGEASIVQEGIDNSGAVRIAPSAEERFGQITFRLDPPPDAGTLFVDLLTKPVAFEEEPGEFIDASGSVTGAFRLVKENDSNKPTAALYVLNGNGLRGGDWIDTGVTFDLDGEGRPLHWMRLTFRQEFQRDDIENSQNRWDLWVDEKLVSVDMGYYDNENVDPGRITLLGHRRIPLLMDGLTVSTGNPLFEDADVNGLADLYESAYGIDSREGDLDSDGLSSIQEYLLGTNPTVADTDQDGLNDGDESKADNRDPLDAGDRTGTAASGTIGNAFDIYVDLTYSDCFGFLGLPGSVEIVLSSALSNSELEIVSAQAQTWSGQSVPTFIDAWSPFTMWIFGLYEPGFEEGVLSLTIRQRADSNSPWEYSSESFEYSCDCSCGCVTMYTATSVDVTIGLGKADFGETARELRIYQSQWSSLLYSRASVQYTGARRTNEYALSNIEVDGRAYPAFDWIRTPSRFVRFTDLERGYVIDIYPSSEVAEDNIPTGEPIKRIRVTDPDPNGLSGVKRLKFEEEIGRPAVREFHYRNIKGRDIWEKYEGSTADYLTRPMRYEKVVYTTTTTSDRDTYRSQPERVMRKETGHWSPIEGRYVVDHVKETTERLFAFGRRKVKEVLDPDGEALTTIYGYDADAPAIDPDDPTAHSYRQHKQWVQHPDGNWEWYAYDQEGRRTGIARPVGNTPRPDAFPDPGPGYEVESFAFDGPGYRTKITETKDGHFIKNTFRSWNDSSVENREDVIHRLAISYDPAAGADDPDNDVTVSVWSGQNGKLTRREDSTGEVTTHHYSIDGDIRNQITERFHRDGSLASQSEKRVHRSGTVLESKGIDGESGLTTAHSRIDAYDALYRPTVTVDEVQGEITTKGYDCCEVEWSASSRGPAHVTERDILGRVIGQQQGYKDPLDRGNALETVTSRSQFNYDGMDRRIKALALSANSDAEPMESSNHFNLAGQRTSEKSSNGITTEYKTIMLEDGGQIQLTSLPKSGQDNRHRITQTRYDADSTLRQTLTYASRDPFATKPDPRSQFSNVLYTEGQDNKGRYKEEANIANIFDIRRTRTYFDEEGRKAEVIRAYGSHLAASEHFDYNQDGQLIRHINPDGVTTRNAYNEKGERTTTAIDLDIQPNEPADHIDYEVDRISVVDHSLIQRDEESVKRTTTTVYTKSGPITTSIQETALDGTQSKSWQYNQLTTTTRTEGSEPGSWTITTTDPNGAYVQQSYQYGQLKQTSRHANDGTLISWTAQTHDSYNRVPPNHRQPHRHHHLSLRRSRKTLESQRPQSRNQIQHQWHPRHRLSFRRPRPSHHHG